MVVWMGDEDKRRLDKIAELWQDVVLNIRGGGKSILKFFVSKIVFMFALLALCVVIFVVRLIIGGQKKR